MSYTSDHLSLLGLRVSDRVTGFSGVVTSVSFDLYGCVQAVVVPGINNEGKIGDALWFDIARLSIDSPIRVMKVPNFEWSDESIAKGGKGPAEKPAMKAP